MAKIHNFTTSFMVLTRYTLSLVIFLLIFGMDVSAQNSVQRGVQNKNFNIDTLSYRSILIPIQYGAHLPAADLKDRFGFHMSIGLGLELKTTSNWIFGINNYNYFGNLINEEDLLAPLQNEDGFITSIDGVPADISLFMRGYTIGIHAGKIIPIFKKNANSGILISAGGGFLQHKIRVLDREENTPQLDPEFLNGYDRLSNGLFLNQFFGILYLSNNRLVNFKAGIELMEGFTASRRDYYFLSDNQPEGNRFDFNYGLRVGWIIPFYDRSKEERYYID